MNDCPQIECDCGEWVQLLLGVDDIYHTECHSCGKSIDITHEQMKAWMLSHTHKEHDGDSQ